MATGPGLGLLMTSVAAMRHTLRSILPNYSTAVTHVPQDTTETPLEHQEAVFGTTDQHRAYKHFGLMGLVVIGLGASMPYSLYLWQYYQTHESTDDAYVVGELIPVSARVQGTVVAVHIADHQQVEAGQVLAQLDPRDFEMRVKQAEVAVEVAAARLHREEIEVSMTQGSTRSSTARAGATVRAAHSALQEAQQRVNGMQARLRICVAAVAAAQADIDLWNTRLDTAGRALARIQYLVDEGIVAHQHLDEAEGTLRARQAEKRASQERLAQAQNEVERVQAELRMQQQAVEQARARVLEAQAQLEGSQSQHQQVAMQQAQVRVAQAQLQQAQAELGAAQLQLDDTILRAPMAGVVTKKRLEPGQTVQAGRPVLTIVRTEPVWVEANFKETQIQHMRPGHRTTLRVDAYGSQVLTGTVASINPGTGSIFSLLPPENATGNFVKVVQRVPVKIILDTPPLDRPILRPGMSVQATVATR
jgi:membrane fusion protein, multidrug efflux system